MNCDVLLGADSYRKSKSPRNILRNRLQSPPPTKTGRKKEVENSSFRFITEFDLPGRAEKDEDGGQKSKRSVLPDYLQTEWPPFDDDLNEENKEPRPSPSQLCYSAACKMMRVTPVKCFFDGLRKNSIIMKNHLLGYTGARTCAIALTKNCDVSILTLEGNRIGGRGAACIGQAIRENFCITELSLADNALCSLGAKSICEALCKNRSVRKLNLAGNGFKERDAVHFRQLLEENTVLLDLNISHNEFREAGGETLAEGLCYNDSLQSLNLSWNHLRLKGATAIGNSLQENNGLENLNLAWNGFHIEGCTAVGQSLCCNKTLKMLDLSCNRVYEYCLPPLVDALEKNNTLEVLKSDFKAFSLLFHSLDTTPWEWTDPCPSYSSYESGSSAINDLDLGIQCVSTEFVDSEKRIALRRPFKTKHGIVLSPTATYDGEDKRDSRLFEGDSPMLVLMEFMRLQNLRLVDLFSTLDKNSDHQITHEEIRTKLQSTSVPLSDTAIERLIVRLDTDSSGTIDFGELFAGQKEHKIVVQKLLSRAEGAWEDTTIGKISIKLQHVMDKQLIMRSKERAAAERYQREDEEKRQRLKRRQDEIERVKREAAQQQLLMKVTQH